MHGAIGKPWPISPDSLKQFPHPPLLFQPFIKNQKLIALDHGVRIAETETAFGKPTALGV